MKRCWHVLTPDTTSCSVVVRRILSLCLMAIVAGGCSGDVSKLGRSLSSVSDGDAAFPLVSETSEVGGSSIAGGDDAIRPDSELASTDLPVGDVVAASFDVKDPPESIATEDASVPDNVVNYFDLTGTSEDAGEGPPDDNSGGGNSDGSSSGHSDDGSGGGVGVDADANCGAGDAGLDRVNGAGDTDFGYDGAGDTDFGYDGPALTGIFDGADGTGEPDVGTPQVAVSILPDTVTVVAGQSASFSAVVSGSTDTEVVWSVTEGLAGGTVSSDGFYTAPAVSGTYHVVATSHLIFSQFAIATVTVVDVSVPADAGSTAPPTHVSRDSMGWTIVAPSSDTRVIHVSSSGGSDANSGSEVAPLKTIAAGVKLLRSGFPDWLLLKTGDTWHESFRIAGGGRSEDEPLLVSSYGSGPRPQVQPSTNPTLGSSGQSPHVYIIGLDFYDPTKDPSSASFQDGAPDLPGIDWTAGGDDILVEDCSFRFLAGGLNIQGYSMPIMDKVQIRRNLISDMYSNSSFCQGGYFKQITNLLIEENTFDHNAWIVDPKVTPNSNNGPNIYNHHLYLEGSLSGVVVRGNLLLRDSSLSLKFVNYCSVPNTTVNVVVDDNFFFEGEVGISVSYGAQGGLLTSGSSSSGFTIQNNVLLQVNRDNPTKRGLGWGMQIKSLANSVIKSNIFSDFSYTDNAYAIALIGDDDTFIDSSITIDSNIAYRIHDQAFLVAPRAGWSDNHVTNNTIQDPNLGAAMVSHQGSFTATSYSGNTYSPSNANNFALIASAPGASSAQVTYQQWISHSGETVSKVASPGFPHPELNLDTYVTKLNPSWTVSNFYTAIRTQSRLNWHPEYMASAINDYIRSGFGVAALKVAHKPGTPGAWSSTRSP